MEKISPAQAVGKTVGKVEVIHPHYEVEFYDNGVRYTQRIYGSGADTSLDPLWDRVLRFNTAASYHASLKVPGAHTP